MRSRPLAAALVIVLGAPLVGGCRDDEATTTATIQSAPTPAPSAPTTASELTTSSTSTSETTTSISETTTSISGGDSTPPEIADSEDNDLPPQPGSPEEAFEQECEKHPDRCG